MTGSETKLPGFFLAGAPKSGTTALYRYLRDHPGVFLPRLKEPHFFSEDLPGTREITTREQYIELFGPTPAGCLSGEASASYLMSREAIPAILELIPAAKFIVILRNPVEMAYALHGELFYNLTEDIESFPEAWALQESRAQGRNIPRQAKEPKLLQYRVVCAIGDQLERFMARVPPQQRLVLLFDELKGDPSSIYSRILSFLALPSDERREFRKENPNKVLRFRRLAHLHRDLPRLLGPLYRPARAMGSALGFSPSRILERVNVRESARPPLDPHFRRSLEAEFQPQVEKVARLLGMELNGWLGHGGLDPGGTP